LAIGIRAGNIQLWNAHHRRGTSASLAFAARTGDLFAVDERGNGFSWPMSVAAWMQHTCAVAGRNLARAEWARLDTGRPYAAGCR
jgi:hypothetical protein